MFGIGGYVLSGSDCWKAIVDYGLLIGRLWGAALWVVQGRL